MALSRRKFVQMSSAAAFSPLWTRINFPANDSSLCSKLQADPLRPQFHLLPARNWMNDPNGPIYFGGRYHMFHQYNPLGATWGNMHWAHATSPDMIHWQHEPLALTPTSGGPDADGVFSGSAVVDRGRVAMIYTGVAPPASPTEATLRDGQHTWRETQCLAIAEDDDLRRWRKIPEPVIAKPPAGLEVTGFRDPALWREGDKWMLIVGAGVHGKGGMILLYTSTDLRHWTYLHPLVEGSPTNSTSANPVDSGEMWECPDFFPLGEKHVLLISTMGKVRWKVGTYSHQRFTPEKEGIVDWGSYYAAKTMLDAEGRRILWGWIPETRPDAELTAAGWAGAMSLPRVVSLTSKNELKTEVAPVLNKIRGDQLAHLDNAEASSTLQSAMKSMQIKDLAAEIEMRVEPKADQFKLRLNSDRGDFVSISCSRESGVRQLHANKVTAPLPGVPGSPLRLHMFLDGSVLELFANDTIALTARVYQIPSGPLRVELEGDVKRASLHAFQIMPISKDRLTSSLCS
jgi:beta-fructofuranosidase